MAFQVGTITLPPPATIIDQPAPVSTTMVIWSIPTDLGALYYDWDNTPWARLLPDTPATIHGQAKPRATFQWIGLSKRMEVTIADPAPPTTTEVPLRVDIISPTLPVSTPSQTTAGSSSSQPDSSNLSTQPTDQPTGESTSPIFSPTSRPSPQPASQGGVSQGAAAGIAIGCLVAGALIAGSLLWFFCIRSGKRRGVRDAEASSVALIRTEKGLSANVKSLGSGSPVSQTLDNGLPQPLEDGAISGEISKVSNLIKNHVQSYYHHSRVSPGLLDLDDLQALGNNLPISLGTLSTLLGNSDTREIALRFSIAWVIISRIHPSGDSNSTFLPPEVATCLQSIPVNELKSRNHTTFLNRWRVVTAELMQSSYGRSTFPVTDPRTRNIEKAADILDRVLRPYMDSRVDNGQRRRNLEEILKRAALFAFTLFSQPSSWDFDWKSGEGVQSGSLCVFPALVQVTSESGDPVNPPRAFSEAIVRRLDG